MKRIVREIDTAIHYGLHQNLVIEFKASLWTKEDVNSAYCLVDQITFEQAFVDYKIKPIAFVKDNLVLWVMNIGESGHTFRINLSDRNDPVWLSSNDLLTLFHNKSQFYQSESWEIFNEIDLPTLIRMARESI